MIRHVLPNRLKTPLWGNRKKWGLVVNSSDKCWQSWQQSYGRFYEENQRAGVGTKINDAGYRVMSEIDLSGKVVLEVGAGDIRHIRYWNNSPDKYIVADISKIMMEKAQKRLREHAVPHNTLFLERNQGLPLENNPVDVVISFYSLEHLYPLKPYLEEMYRVLKPGGVLIGAIPAEGGLVWGAGRLLTSRRWFKKNTDIDPDKIICWEHPNFADEVIAEMDQIFKCKKNTYWPLSWFPLLDVNLIIQFIYEKNH